MSQRKIRKPPLMPGDQVEVFLPGVGIVAGVVESCDRRTRVHKITLIGTYDIPERSLSKIPAN